MRISDWSSDVCSSDLIRTKHPREARASIRPISTWIPAAVLLQLQAQLRPVPIPAISKLHPTFRRPSRHRRQPRRAGRPCHQSRIRHKFMIHSDFGVARSEEHTSELQSLMRNSYAVFCLKKKIHDTEIRPPPMTNQQHTMNRT